MNEISDKGMQLLVEAIVAQAADDYRRAVANERKSRERGHFIPSATKREVEQFFRSRWFEMLTGMDGAAVLSRLEEIV